MNLKKFIEEHGVEQIAVKLDITASAVLKWKQGNHAPRPEQAKKLIALSKGKLSWSDVYANYAKRPRTTYNKR